MQMNTKVTFIIVTTDSVQKYSQTFISELHPQTHFTALLETNFYKRNVLQIE